MDTSPEYTCLGILPAIPRVGGKPDHVSSQGKEAVFVTHDTLPQVVKASVLYYKNKKYIYQNHSIFLHLSTINYGEVKLTSATTLRVDKLKPPPPIIIT